jgi:hypothetical protein
LAKTYQKLGATAAARSPAVAQLSIADSFPGDRKRLSAVFGFFFVLKPTVTFGQRHKEEKKRR